MRGFHGVVDRSSRTSRHRDCFCNRQFLFLILPPFPPVPPTPLTSPNGLRNARGLGRRQDGRRSVPTACGNWEGLVTAAAGHFSGAHAPRALLRDAAAPPRRLHRPETLARRGTFSGGWKGVVATSASVPLTVVRAFWGTWSLLQTCGCCQHVVLVPLLPRRFH